jgi:uncharacterized membrane protein YfcA
MLAMLPSVETLSPWLDPNLTNHLAMLVGIFLLGGLVRGATGFGGAMVMILPLAMIFSMPQAIAISFVLEFFGPLLILRAALRRVMNSPESLGLLKSFLFWSVLGLPLGSLLQRYLNSETVGFITSLTIATIALAMLFRFTRVTLRVTARLTRLVAMICGTLITLTGVSGPIVATYFLLGVSDGLLTRAMMHVYVTFICVFTLAILFGLGLAGAEVLPVLVLGLPIYILASATGQRLTDFMSPCRLRQLVLVFILLSSVVFLVRFLPK